MLQKIISGGQTGADRAALDVAIKMGIPHGGWVPKGRKTEKGRLPARYQLKEIHTVDYAQRTELNVMDSDATLLFSHGTVKGGSALTRTLAKNHHKPCLHMDLNEIDEDKATEMIKQWLQTRNVRILNVAGPRESEDPLIYDCVKKILRTLF
jgi:predicted Rossmann-fold nucleotide-binding protein